MKFCENMKLDMLKIIIIIIGYILNNFTIKKRIYFLKKIIICFVNVETDPRPW
jgi:hypothetical protein